MMNRGNIKNWFMLASLVFVMITGREVCGIRAASAAAKPIKLRMMVVAEPAPASIGATFQTDNVSSQPIVYNVMEPLVDMGKKGEPVPKLATKWEHSQDFIKWRFYLRRGVKFHNGAEFTARDVAEYAKWVIEQGKGGPLYRNVPLKEAVAVDDYTVDLVFATPQPLLLIGIRSFLVPPVAISRDNREMFNRIAIGTGPYRFVEWKRGLHIKLAKFEGYWGPKPQIDEVEITSRGEEAVRLAALMAGEVDWIFGLGPEEATRAPKVARVPSPETVWIRFDESVQKDPIFADKRLRLAVEYAIDRQALVALYSNFATPSLGQFASPGDFGFNPGLKSRLYDLEKAKALVREAGAVGKSVTFAVPTDKWTKAREVAEAVAYMIERAGLKVKLLLLPKLEHSKYWSTYGQNRQYMADLHMNATEAVLEVEGRFEQLFVEGGNNYALNDPEPTKLFKEAVAQIDIANRGEKVGKAWAYVYEQAHYVPLFKLEAIWGMGKNLKWDIDRTGSPFIADMRFAD